MIKLEHVVLASPEQMEFIVEGMRNAKIRGIRAIVNLKRLDMTLLISILERRTMD